MRYSSRTSSRIAAVQALYQISQSTDLSTASVVAQFDGPVFDDENKYPSMDRPLFESLVNGAVSEKAHLEAILTQHIKDDRVGDKMSAMMQSILLPAVYEIESFVETAQAIIISEYVSIGHLFFHGREPAFIHDILGQVSTTIRK